MSSVTGVLEGNVLIAEFMGTIIHKETYSAGGHRTVLYKMPDEKTLYASEFLYHSDWNWIMPVYLKAKEEIKPKLMRGRNDKGNLSRITVYKGSNKVKEAGELILEGKCLEASEKLVEAIKWHNKSKEKISNVK